MNANRCILGQGVRAFLMSVAQVIRRVPKQCVSNDTFTSARAVELAAKHTAQSKPALVGSSDPT
jgi:hypothetical protein